VVKKSLGRRKTISIIVVILIVSSLAIALFLFLNYPPVYYHQPDTVTDGFISSNQAYSIAMPYIREYGHENNRLILRIDVSFWNSSRDFNGQRGDSSLRYPVWTVTASFAKDYLSPHSFEGYPYGITGYSVSIWADTGQLKDKGEQGIM
jgi:hypothetical protein